MRFTFPLVLASLAFAGSAFAQTKWDLPAGYPANNFHTENLMQFVDEVDKATGGKLKITVHANASLFKAPEIKRAVQGGQAQIGEILLSNFSNEWPIFGVDGLPFLADSYDDRPSCTRRSARCSRRSSASRACCCSTRWPGRRRASTCKKPINSAADLKGVKWRAYNPATARIAELVGAQPVTVQAAELSQAMATGVVERTCRRARPATTPRPTSTSSTSTTPRPGCRRTRCWSTRPRSTRSTSRPRPRCSRPGRRRDPRLGDVEGQEHRVPRAAEEERHDDLPPSPQLKADMKKVGDTMLQEWLQKAGPEGQASSTPTRRCDGGLQRLAAHSPSPRARWPCMTALPALAGLCMSVARWHGAALHRGAGSSVQRCRSPDSYCRLPRWRRPASLALAHTLKRGGAHRVTLLISALHATLESAASRSGLLAAATARAVLFCRIQLASSAWQSHAFNDISTANDATPLWLPQLTMALGTIVLAIASSTSWCSRSAASVSCMCPRKPPAMMTSPSRRC
jgi:hypothetical protein